MESLIVFVHLGTNPAPTLIQNAVHASEYLPEAKLVLITTHPKNWVNFPGEILTYAEENRSTSMKEVERRFPEYRQIGNGYWLHTLERIFALELLAVHFDPSSCVLHIESDVASFITKEILEIMSSVSEKVSVPRYSTSEGVASIVFAPSVEILKTQLQELSIHLGSLWITDMELLGLGLNLGILSELEVSVHSNVQPSTFNLEGYYLLFDALPIGQYFGGRDPLHSSGRAISGFINENLPFEIEDYVWDLIDFQNRKFITISNSYERFLIVNLHMHSKRILQPLNSDDRQWLQLIAEANNKSPRIPTNYVPDLIHTIPVSFTNRLRLLRRRGLFYTLRQVQKRLLRK